MLLQLVIMLVEISLGLLLSSFVCCSGHVRGFPSSSMRVRTWHIGVQCVAVLLDTSEGCDRVDMRVFVSLFCESVL